MSNEIYRLVPLEERSFLQKLFKQYSNENAVIELNNLLAQKPICDIEMTEVEEIESRYQVKLNKEYPLNLEEFYAVYLSYCLTDSFLTEEEIKKLKHLKYILSLSDKSVDHLNTKIGLSVYKASFEEAVSDGKITASEEVFLNKLQSDLKLPKQLTDKIETEIKTSFINNYVGEIVSDRRISPAEERELNELARNLNVKINLNEESLQKLTKMKLYWALENLMLPVVDVDIPLQKAESCYLKITFANWYEHRVRHSNNYGAYAVNKNAMNFYLDANSRACNTHQLSLIDKGELYLTNKRIIFIGQNKTSNIRIDKIFSVKPFTDGLEIMKDTGKNPVIQVRDKADVLCLILERLMRNDF